MLKGINPGAWENDVVNISFNAATAFPRILA